MVPLHDHHSSPPSPRPSSERHIVSPMHSLSDIPEQLAHIPPSWSSSTVVSKSYSGGATSTALALDPVTESVPNLAIPARSDTPAFPSCALSRSVTQSRHPQAVYIDWTRPYDAENPFDWPTSRKWIGTLSAFFFTLLTAMSATSYPSATAGAVQEFHTSVETFLTGSTAYLISVSFTPMIIAPASEVYGRRPIYVTAAVLYALFQIPICLAPNIGTLIAFRWFQGMTASVGNSMVGGSVADIFNAQERGTLMALFALLVYVGQSIGPVVSGFLAQSRLGWRWVFWWQLIVSGLNLVSCVFLLRETRGSVLLSRRARHLTELTGIIHRTAADDERTSFLVMARTSLIRPFSYLVTEPVVIAISIWVAFAWGCLFLLTESIPLVFAQYGFDQGQQSLVFLTIAVGGISGFASNLHQNRLFISASRKAGGKAAPEYRLHWSCIGGILFPIGMYWYAWGGRPSVHWIIPAIGIFVVNAGIFPIYVVSYSYLADSYERYSSSALAAQSFLRNILAGTFPLFAVGMYGNLGYPQASTLLAAIGTVLAVVPFVMFYFGARIRAHSRVVLALQKEDEEAQARRAVWAEAARKILQDADPLIVLSKKPGDSLFHDVEKDGTPE